MNLVRSLLPLAAAVGLVACGAPSPEKVCDHAVSLIKKEAGDALNDEGLKELKEECVKESKKEQEKDSAAYATKAKCFMAANTMEEAMKCEPKDSEPPAE
jgi:hypothetical protein